MTAYHAMHPESVVYDCPQCADPLTIEPEDIPLTIDYQATVPEWAVAAFILGWLVLVGFLCAGIARDWWRDRG